MGKKNAEQNPTSHSTLKGLVQRQENEGLPQSLPQLTPLLQVANVGHL